MLPSISVIIPVRPGGMAQGVLESVAAIDYPEDRIEVLVAEGTQPSKQRNEAARQGQRAVPCILWTTAR